MPSPDQHVVLLRHGETEWSRTLRHTGRTDVPLTEAGRAQARAVRGSLPFAPFDLVLTSPLRRATDPAELAGHPGAEADADLMEGDYGEVEGRTTVDIRASRPGWDIWRDGAPAGELVDEVGARV